MFESSRSCKPSLRLVRFRIFINSPFICTSTTSCSCCQKAWTLVSSNSKTPEDPTKGRTGHGGLYPALFSRSDICSKPIPNYLHVLDYMFSFSWHSCCGEHAGSYINQIKTTARTELAPETLDCLTYNSFNMPNLHEIDFKPVIKKWSEDGRMSGVLKSDPTRSSAESKVVRRHLSEVGGTSLFTGKSPYEPS